MESGTGPFYTLFLYQPLYKGWYRGPKLQSLKGLAARHGFEPRFTAPKAAVLPLDDRGMQVKCGCYSTSVPARSASSQRLMIPVLSEESLRREIRTFDRPPQSFRVHLHLDHRRRIAP